MIKPVPHVDTFEAQCGGKQHLRIPTLHRDPQHTALLPGLVARCALVESGGGSRDVLQQHAARVAVVYASRKDAIPSAQALHFMLILLHHLPKIL